jgi:predicted small lipoprotein YifL
MKKVIAVAALLALAACGKKETPAPAADTTTAAPTVPTDTAAHDSTMPRDTAHQM